MAVLNPLTISLGLGFLSNVLARGPKSLMDNPRFQERLKKLRGFTTEAGARAETEKAFAPAREQITRQMLALGPPGASGAVSGALAGVYGQQATAITDLMRSSEADLLNLETGLSSTPDLSRPASRTPNFLRLGALLAYMKYLKRGKGVPVPSAIPDEELDYDSMFGSGSPPLYGGEPDIPEF